MSRIKRIIKKGIPRGDGSGQGVGANRGRGGCKPILRRRRSLS